MSQTLDMVIVGGGIHGVGIAQAAAVRGHDVLLLEQSALGAGTSSRSSKLIHGGLRYLEHGDFQLVRESLKEREILLAIAPHLVARRTFHIPLYEKSRRSPWQVAFGLTLYRLFAGTHGGFKRLAPGEWNQLDGLNTDRLKAVFSYQDAQADDLALTVAVARSAESYGAKILTGARFLGAERRTHAYEVHYVENGIVTTCVTKTLVNAAGPWVGHVLASISPGSPRQPYDLVQGTHIVTKGTLARGAYYVEAPADHRPVFVMPWKGAVLTGTTETLYVGDPGHAVPLPQEVAYLQEVLAAYFPHLDSTPESAFTGLRVLPKAEGSLNKRPRRPALLADQPNAKLVSVLGGKLTAYRLTAERVLARLQGSLPSRTPQADTRYLPLPA